MCRLMVSTLASLLSCKLSEPSGNAPCVTCKRLMWQSAWMPVCPERALLAQLTAGLSLSAADQMSCASDGLCSLTYTVGLPCRWLPGGGADICCCSAHR